MLYHVEETQETLKSNQSSIDSSENYSGGRGSSTTRVRTTTTATNTNKLGSMSKLVVPSALGPHSV